MTSDGGEARSLGLLFSLLHRAVVAEPFAEPPAGWREVTQAASRYGQVADISISPGDFDACGR